MSAPPAARAAVRARTDAGGRVRTAERTRPEARSPAGHPDPERLARAVVQLYLEVEAGRRAFAQLEPILTPALATRLRGPVRARGPKPTGAAVLAIRATRPRPGACDAAVVVREGRRVGVLVIRLELHQRVWRVVELARPRSGRRNRQAP